MTHFETVKRDLQQAPRRWLVTGAAGFIGSHLVQTLLNLGQSVVGLDNFATGSRENVAAALAGAPADAAERYRLLEADIRNPDTCKQACEGIDIVLHQAALASVPRSLKDPQATHDVNVTGSLQMLLAARSTGVRRFVFASSSSVYGDEPNLPKREDRIGKPLSPYAATKYVNEVYAATLGLVFGIETIGLRYFNVFGPRQSPTGPYAAVIPLWFDALRRGTEVYIYGDGETSRDFCYVGDAVQANLLAAVAPKPAIGKVYNVATGQRTTLNRLFTQIRAEVARVSPAVKVREPILRDFRPGDIRHSQADITSAGDLLGYAPSFTLASGLRAAAEWYLSGA